jgi:hypothetical protein
MNQLVVVGDQVVNNQADGSPQQQSDRGFEQSYSGVAEESITRNASGTTTDAVPTPKLKPWATCASDRSLFDWRP